MPECQAGQAKANGSEGYWGVSPLTTSSGHWFWLQTVQIPWVTITCQLIVGMEAHTILAQWPPFRIVYPMAWLAKSSPASWLPPWFSAQNGWGEQHKWSLNQWLTRKSVHVDTLSWESYSHVPSKKHTHKSLVNKWLCNSLLKYFLVKK